jgi:glutaminyl-peptide cyclotransferase
MNMVTVAIRIDPFRSLADSWESDFHPAMSTYQNPLDSISLFVLLDLLGSPKPRVPSYFKTTHWAYQHMALIESRMRTMGLLASDVDADHPFLPEYDKTSDAFHSTFGIQDDHLPFMARGVEILHIIPSPFPQGIWHTSNDDGEHLDMATVEDWSRILTAFVSEWMDLEEHLPLDQVAQSENDKRYVSTLKTEL